VHFHPAPGAHGRGSWIPLVTSPGRYDGARDNGHDPGFTLGACHVFTAADHFNQFRGELARVRQTLGAFVAVHGPGKMKGCRAQYAIPLAGGKRGRISPKDPRQHCPTIVWPALAFVAESGRLPFSVRLFHSSPAFIAAAGQSSGGIPVNLSER